MRPWIVLSTAAGNGHVQVLQWLVENGANCEWWLYFILVQLIIQTEKAFCGRFRDPDSISPDACLRLHRQDRISLFNWLICLMKRAFDFATKLNSRDIKKCYCFWVPSYDLFASTRKTVFPAPTATVVYRLRNKWSSLWEGICHKIVHSPFWTKVWTPPPPFPPNNKNSWICPWVFDVKFTKGLKKSCYLYLLLSSFVYIWSFFSSYRSSQLEKRKK